MGRRGNGRRGAGSWLLREFWAAILFFLTGAGFLLLAAIGRVYWGDAFDGDVLKYPGWGLIIVTAYVIFGVNVPRLLQGQRVVDRERDADDDTAEVG